MRCLGDRIESFGTVFQIFSKLWIVAKDYKDLQRVLKQIENEICIKDENGENMVLSLSVE